MKMAKLKVVLRDIGFNKIKAASASMKSKNATPNKVVKKGKATHKNNSNVKVVNGDRINDDYINKYLEIQSRTRLCFVKVKRIRNTNEKIGDDTLQAQCKDATDNNTNNPNINQSNKENDAIHTGISVANPTTATAKTRQPHSSRKQTVGGLSTRTRCRPKLQVPNIDSIKSATPTLNTLECPEKKNIKWNLPAVTGKKQQQQTTPTEELHAFGELKDGTASSFDITNPTLDKEKRNGLRKLSLSASKHQHRPTNSTTTQNKEKNTTDKGVESTANSQTKLLPAKPMKLRTANKKIVETKPNSTANFEHVRNSTVLENSPCKSLFEKDALNQTHTNENIRSPVSKSIVNLSNISPANNRTNKFFHRVEIESNGENKQPVVKENVLSKKRVLSKRSSQVRREKVYDFLSQSQTSDGVGGNGIKTADPTADIIKKLIEQGKVAVAINQKGKGRPKLKRNLTKTTKKAMAAKKNDKYKEGKKKKTAIHPTNNMLGDLTPYKDKAQVEDDDEDYGHFDNFLNEDADVDFNMNEFARPVERVKKVSQHHITDQEGTFSNLAKSVLITQAGLTDSRRIKAQRLLAMAKKLISTPKNNKIPTPQTALNADFSPIAISNTRPASLPSPWRVDEDAHLPRVFNFSRSSGNLPSFSSDFIPATPRKEKPQNKALEILNEISHNQNQEQSKSSSIEMIQGVSKQQPDGSPLPTIDSVSSTPLAVHLNFSAPSSFSSNDSNAENKTPPNPGPDKTSDNNANIFDLKQLPNPRRALRYRSPLKAINILEVVHLPPLQNIDSMASKGKKHDDMAAIDTFKTPPEPPNNRKSKTIAPDEELFGFEDMAANDTFNTPSKPSNNNKSKTNSPDKELFGFEEFLSQTDMSSQESQSLSIEHSKNPIHDKLHSLRKLRPNSCDLQISLQQTESSKQVPNLFNDPQHISKPQKTIKQMLCSTMIQQPSTSKQCLQELHTRNFTKQRAMNCVAEEDSANISELFKDPEPETTFNEEDPHRTYIRPYKRKRRLKENRLIFVYDSDASDDEPNDSTSPEKKKNRAHHQSHETDTSSEKPQKKKRKVKEKPELTHFVEEFNEMCKEVDNYELIMEKSA